MPLEPSLNLARQVTVTLHGLLYLRDQSTPVDVWVGSGGGRTLNDVCSSSRNAALDMTIR